jgi:hypothetical protein
VTTGETMQAIRTTALAVGIAIAIATPATAQIDYRNLDDERPTLTEDAYPVEHYAFELILPYSLEREHGGQRAHVFAPELAYGVVPNLQLGIKAPIAGLRMGGGDTRWGLAGLRVSGLYNFNTEARRLPALSLRADAGVPVGSLAGDAARLTLKGIATRSFGLTRVHLNAAHSLGDDAGVGAVEAAPRWSFGVAVDRTLFRQSTLLVAEAYALRDVRGAPVEVNAAFGARYQWTPTTVFDAGFTHRLRSSAGPALSLTVGFTHAFGVRTLMPGAAR